MQHCLVWERAQRQKEAETGSTPTGQTVQISTGLTEAGMVTSEVPSNARSLDIWLLLLGLDNCVLWPLKGPPVALNE